MSTTALIDAVLKELPDADPNAVLDLIVSCNADLDKVFKLLGIQSASKKRQMTFDNFVARKPSKVLKTSADIITLHTSEQVKNANIRCSLHLNVLDPSVANRLAVDLEAQSAFWNQRSFYLFERLVTSGHKSALYTDDEDLLSGKKSSNYQGSELNVAEIFEFTPEMKVARSVVESIVQKFKPGWHSQVAVVNRYASRFEKLDYHSDQLTNIGIRPIIAGLSLGCTREFRIKDRRVPPQRPTYSIRVPHNSLLIMHEECQERFKHCIPPSKSESPDPLLGTNRISITFRMYKSDNSTIPKCTCDVPMVLRSTLPDKNGDFKYIWQCSAHYRDGKGCGEWRRYNEST